MLQPLRKVVIPFTISCCSAAYLLSLLIHFFFKFSVNASPSTDQSLTNGRLSISHREMIMLCGGWEIDSCSKATKIMQASIFFQIHQKIFPWKLSAIQGLIFLRFEEAWTRFAGIARMGRDETDGDELLMMEWASKDLIPWWQRLKSDRGSLQKCDKQGIRAQNRNVSWSYAVHLLPGKALEAILRLSVKKVQVSPAACAMAQTPQWEENPC